MSARSKARKRALDVLYEADIRGTVPADVLSATEQRRSDEGQAAMNSYVTEVIDGVTLHREYIDELLGSLLDGLEPGPDAGGGPRDPAHRRLRAALA